MSHKVVGRDEWLKASAAFLEKEKQFTHLRDDLARQRRELPWMLVEKNYVFESPASKKSLADLFQGKSQLFVQHFMFAPEWNEGCQGCSFQADHIDGALVHFTQRDVSFAAISRAPVEKLEAFRKRMNWHFNWVSSGGNDFNYDFNVSFKEGQEKVSYNFRTTDFIETELPGNSMFYKDASGKIFRTYSSYARGCEMLMSTYMMLDLLPKGRDEEPFKVHPMEWVKHHDKYGSEKSHDCCH